MCGGRGTRLDAAVEKPLLEIGGRPMIERVLAALESSDIDTVHAVTAPQAPETRASLAGGSVSHIEAPGDGYVEDLGYALDRVGCPVLTVAADLPLLDGDAIDRVLDVHDGGSLAVCVPRAVKRVLGVSVDPHGGRNGGTLVPAGVNVVSDTGDDAEHVTYDVRFAVNVNRDADVRVAEALA